MLLLSVRVLQAVEDQTAAEAELDSAADLALAQWKLQREKLNKKSDDIMSSHSDNSDERRYNNDKDGAKESNRGLITRRLCC